MALKICRYLLLLCIGVYAVALLIGVLTESGFFAGFSLLAILGMMIMAPVCLVVQVVSAVHRRRNSV